MISHARPKPGRHLRMILLSFSRASSGSSDGSSIAAAASCRARRPSGPQQRAQRAIDSSRWRRRRQKRLALRRRVRRQSAPQRSPHAERAEIAEPHLVAREQRLHRHRQAGGTGALVDVSAVPTAPSSGFGVGVISAWGPRLLGWHHRVEAIGLVCHGTLLREHAGGRRDDGHCQCRDATCPPAADAAVTATKCSFVGGAAEAKRARQGRPGMAFCVERDALIPSPGSGRRRSQ